MRRAVRLIYQILIGVVSKERPQPIHLERRQTIRAENGRKGDWIVSTAWRLLAIDAGKECCEPVSEGPSQIDVSIWRTPEHFLPQTCPRLCVSREVIRHNAVHAPPNALLRKLGEGSD